MWAGSSRVAVIPAQAGTQSKSKPSGVARQPVTFFCFAKMKVTKEKATPVCRQLRGFPPLLDRSGFLINSHDPLRVHVLKHIRQNSLTSLRYSAAHRGKKSKPKNLMPRERGIKSNRVPSPFFLGFNDEYQSYR